MQHVYNLIDPSGMIAATGEEIHLVASLYAYFDESGKFKDHKITSFCGFLADFHSWERFADNWRYWLKNVGIQALHSSEAFNTRRSLSGKRPAKDTESRVRELSKFIRPIKEQLEFGIVQVIDVEAFNALPSETRRMLGEDPHYLVFQRAITDLVKRVMRHNNATVSLICDDEEKYSVECYKLLGRMKREDQSIRRAVISICFGDDEQYPQIQAADFLSGVMRLEASRRFHGDPFGLQAIYNEMVLPEASSRLDWNTGHFWGAGELVKLAADIRQKKRKLNRG